MHYNVWRDKNLCSTNLCDRCLTRIFCINKTCTEKCRFTVIQNLESLTHFTISSCYASMHALNAYHAIMVANNMYIHDLLTTNKIFFGTLKIYPQERKHIILFWNPNDNSLSISIMFYSVFYQI